MYTNTDTSYVHFICNSQKITLNDLFIEFLKIQTFNGLPIHLIEILHENEKKKNMETWASNFRDKRIW
jgi:hypothetical protein